MSNTDTQPDAGLAASDTDVDALLAEFDSTARAPAEAPSDPTPLPPLPAADPSPAPQQHDQPRSDNNNGLEARLNDLQLKLVMDEAKRDYGAVVNRIRGDSDVSEKFVHNWIDLESRADPRLQQVWLGRRENPAEFERVVEKLERRFQKEVLARQIDRQATDDRELVTAAVRGASGRMPDPAPPNYSRMDDAQFAAEKDKLFGS